MAFCELVDYSERSGSMIELYVFPAVTRKDIVEVNGVISPDQFERVEEGDSLGVYIVDNRVEGIRGLLTIWHNKGVACFNRGDNAAWGEWEPEAGLVLTADLEEAKDEDGAAVMGRIAYNTHGIRGVYSRERFYTLQEKGL